MVIDKGQDFCIEKSSVDGDMIAPLRRECERLGISLDDVLKGRVLDVGCGFGYLPMHLQNDGIDCYGVDNDDIAIQIARTNVKHPEKVVTAEIANMPFASGFFGLAVSNYIFDYVDDKRREELKSEFEILSSITLQIIDDQINAEVKAIIKGVRGVLGRDGLYFIRDDLDLVNEIDFRPFRVIGKPAIGCVLLAR